MSHESKKHHHEDNSSGSRINKSPVQLTPHSITHLDHNLNSKYIRTFFLSIIYIW